MMKYCNGCNIEKHTSDFSIKNQTNDGLECICRICKSTHSKKKYSETKTQTKNAYMLSRAKTRAKDKNLEFNIDINDVVIPNICPVLNIPIILGANNETKSNAPSIDRIDNSKGYTKDNIIIISYKANIIKNSASLNEMYLIYKNWFEINTKQSPVYFKKNSVRDNVRSRKKKHKIDYNLSNDDFIIPEFCSVLGIKLFPGKLHQTDNSPTMDRIDNSKGYIKGNVRIISHKANRLKGIATYEEYQKIYEFYSNLAKNK